ncbi:heparanase-like protein 3 [Abrus precatorius]|uniref:Heparanase-like protein 3 n=1 Tax=Abrus precatorius TaxID=3816 RepID=A0A8B8JN64_ABRPR|nr:heparanase-like protein 3 [Abrus precatorius]
MGCLVRLLGLCLWIYLVSLSFIGVGAVYGRGGAAVKGIVLVHGKSSIGKIDDDFVCATLDWWPPQKCDYGKCSWGHASLLNLDLNNKILLNAVKAFSPLKIRLGGTLQDKVTYGTEDNRQPCTPFVWSANEMFGFTQGCLPMHRWDELNSFFQKAGAKVIFGLNALAGRSVNSGSAVGPWNYTNAESLIRYTVGKKYTIHGWELGNELCGNGIGASVTADQYVSDVAALRNIIQNAYRGIEPKPLVIAPGGFFDSNWFGEFVTKSGKSANVVSHHIYNLGPGVDDHLTEKILDPSYLDGEASTFSSLKSILRSPRTSVKAWVGEAGGAYNSGHHLVSDAFVYSFWYLDQLGMSAIYDTKTYCRQSLIGGNYGLLNTSTFMPNPDYYSALLFHRLMGRRVLSTNFFGTKKIRAYAHCAKESKGITILLLNLDNSTTVQVRAALKFNKLPYRRVGEPSRREYHLTAKDRDLHSQIMLLNGKILTVNSAGEIPPFEPLYVDSSKPIIVGPLSIVFAHIPNVVLSACS